eukprot:SAG31_NODE_828_length_11716_cov_4.405785_10_plen_131_part_00
MERAERAQAYRLDTVAAQIDRKDAQRDKVAKAKIDLRERRAQQARNFFVQRRKLAEIQDKELQNLRFYGRTTAELKASTSVVRKQMATTARLHHAGILHSFILHIVILHIVMLHIVILHIVILHIVILHR